jgi:hypothetical protein
LIENELGWIDDLAGRGLPVCCGRCSRRLQKFLILREGIIYAHYCRILADKEIRPAFGEGMDPMRSNVERSFTEADFEDVRRTGPNESTFKLNLFPACVLKACLDLPDSPDCRVVFPTAE